MLILKYIYNILIGINQLFNAILLGDPDETLSSRIGKEAKRGNKFALFLSKILDFFDENHCEEAIEEDEGKDSIL